MIFKVRKSKRRYRKKKIVVLYGIIRYTKEERVKRKRIFNVLRREAMRHSPKQSTKTSRKRYNQRTYLKVDGVEMWIERYAMKRLIKSIKPSTYINYRKRSIIPAPIYQRKISIFTKKYISKRQIGLINYLWREGAKEPLEERIEYLHAHWTEGELGYRDDSNNND
jgi:hypothetical protein